MLGNLEGLVEPDLGLEVGFFLAALGTLEEKTLASEARLLW